MTSNNAKAQPLHLVPAYGRDYKTSIEALAAWKAGRDFLISDISSPYNGAYCSCRDFTRIQRVMIRYNKLADFVITGGLKPRTKRSFVPAVPPKRTALILALVISGFASALSGCTRMQYSTEDECEANAAVCHMNIWGTYTPGPGIDPNSAAGVALIQGVLSQPLYMPSYTSQPASHFSCDTQGILTFCDSY